MDKAPVKLFGGSIETLTRSLNLRARKHEYILNNVANADTPNFKPYVLDVEKTMQPKKGLPAAGQMTMTDDQHLPGLPPEGASPTADGTRQHDPLLFRGDENGVDIDAEMTALAKNSLLYRASAQIVSSKFSGLKKVITGGNK